MDIIIQNGKINFTEMQKEHDKKNNEGLLKKDFINFNNNTPGPYYDLYNSHLHVWRKPKNISNFHGPQDQKRFKLFQLEWDEKKSYCSICHCKYKINTSFDHNNNFKDLYIPKNELNNTFIKIKLNKNYTNTWINFYNKLTNKKVLINNIKIKRIKIYTKYYQLVYKLIHKPIVYNISSFETKLLYPWELTPYQKFKLENKNYKKSIIYLSNKRITENYIKIETKLQIL